ncbi:hypothetical protein H0H87_009658 [Tephrocybe sp. NHM501043]|nr:hypothetical protein H0H87_009658 [Tephrocybe sp. NHM501043]
MSLKMQELEMQNAKWKQENVKLFQDNQRLTRALHERGETQQAHTIRTLQRQVQALSHDKTMLANQVQSLLSGQPAAYHQLLHEYQRFQGFYQQALQEIATLRKKNAFQTGKPPPSSPVTSGLEALIPSKFTGNQPLKVTLSQQSSHSTSPPNPCLNVNTPAPPINALNARAPIVPVPSQMSNEQSRSSMEQDQIRKQSPDTVDWNRQSRHNHDIDGRLPRSISRIPNRSQPNSRPASSMSISRPTPPQLAVNTMTHAPFQEGSLPTPMTASSLPQRLSYLPPEVSSSAPSAQSPASGDISPSHSLITSPTQPMELSSLVHAPPTYLSASAPPTGSPCTIAPAEAAISQNAIVQAKSIEAVDVQESKLVPLPIKPVVKDHQSASPADPFEAIIPMVMAVDEPMAIPIVSSPPIEQGFLKRPSLSMISLEDLPKQKRPRLETQDSADGAVIPMTEMVDSPKETKMASVEPPREIEVKKESDDEDEGEEENEEEEEEFRVGPDGLVLEEDCLPSLIEDDTENKDQKKCKICTVRFERGHSTVKPKPFINATTEELVLHCTSEHKGAWETLRKGV